MTNILKNKKIVCLGGGIGTSNLIKGLKKYKPQLTIITSMADDGGSSGRLRKAYNIMPPGDIVACIAALIDEKQKPLADLLTYRFPGISKENKAIDGHKLGNLIMFAEILRTKDFYKAIEVTKQLFGVKANIYPASDIRTTLSAITKDGRRVHSENTLDLAKYSQPHGLKKIYLTPKNPKVNPLVIESLLNADLIISGPGDLYTNQLPVLIIPEIQQAIFKSKAEKVFILNVTNKSFETKNFELLSYIQAIKEHLNGFPFKFIIANNNFKIAIQKPHKYKYSYVKINTNFNIDNSIKIIEKDLILDSFPLYHDPEKLASAILNLYNNFL